MTDEQLMTEVSRDKLDRASVLFERYHGRIFGFFINNNHSYEQSQDMTQLVFERMLKYRRSFQVGKSFQAWIFQIARNIRNDQHNKRQKRGVMLDITDMKESWQVTEDPLDEREIHLRRAMDRLEDEQKELLVMSKFQKMKYEQIAEVLDCSVGAVKAKVHRAVKKLRNIYFMVEAE